MIGFELNSCALKIIIIITEKSKSYEVKYNKRKFEYNHDFKEKQNVSKP